MPSVTVAGGYTLIFVGHAQPAANVNINSLSGSGEIEIDANMGATNANESVVLKVAGKNPDGTDMATPFDLSTMSWKQNASVNAANKYDASALQIVYGGPGTISMKGNAQSAATIYAPNADFALQGTQDLFGSVLAKTDHQRRQRQHPLRPPAAARLLRGRPSDDGHVQLEALLIAERPRRVNPPAAA